MSELEEIKDKIKESPKRPKRKLGKRRKIVIIGVIGVIAIFIGSVLYVTLIAPSSEKYWKPEKKFTMPSVDWSRIKDSYLLERGKEWGCRSS